MGENPRKIYLLCSAKKSERYLYDSPFAVGTIRRQKVFLRNHTEKNKVAMSIYSGYNKVIYLLGLET